MLGRNARELLSWITGFKLKYRIGRRAAEAYGVDFQVDLQFLFLEVDPDFEPVASKVVCRPGMKRRQYLANFFRPNRDTGDSIPLIYFAVPTTDTNQLNAEGGGDKIFAGEGGAP